MIRLNTLRLALVAAATLGAALDAHAATYNALGADKSTIQYFCGVQVTATPNNYLIPCHTLTDVAGNPIGTVASPLFTGLSFGGVPLTLGPKASNASIPVALPTDQTVKTDGSGTTQPVSGSVTVSNLPGTQPVSATALPLPTGAASAVLQSATQGAVAPGTAANASTLGGQVYNSTAPAPTSGQQVALQADAAGNLKINNATLPPGAAADTSVTALGTKLDTLHTDAYPAGTAGNPSPQVITVQPPASGGTTQNTAPQSNVPAAVATGTLTNAGDIVSISGVDGYNTISVEILGPAAWTSTTAPVVEMQPKGSTQWYATKIADFEGAAPGISSIPMATAAQLLFKTGGVSALRIRAPAAITNGPVTVNLAGMGGVKDARVSATLGNPLNAALVYNGAVSSLASAFPFQLAYAGAAVAPANRLPVDTSAVAAATDRGGTLTTANTSQSVAALNTSRAALFCENPVSATEDLFFSVTGAATVNGAGNFADVAPGGTVAFTLNNRVIQAAVTVNATTAGHRFYCTEMQ